VGPAFLFRKTIEDAGVTSVHFGSTIESPVPIGVVVAVASPAASPVFLPCTFTFVFVDLLEQAFQRLAAAAEIAEGVVRGRRPACSIT
jgi:hypothetical protein